MKTFIASVLTGLILFGCESGDSKSEMAGDPLDTQNESVGPENIRIDPVSLGKVASDAAWKTYWKGEWYFFESEENLRRFQEAPTKYVTEDGRTVPSRDPISGAEVRRDTEWKTFRDGTWYYFDSEANMRKFEARPKSTK
jgi:YHS domain-containing protein